MTTTTQTQPTVHNLNLRAMYMRFISEYSILQMDKSKELQDLFEYLVDNRKKGVVNETEIPANILTLIAKYL